MSLTGILLDVSGSMESNIGSGTDEEGGPWARSIFKVIDDLIEHDVSSENRVFALGVGASCSGKEIFDVIGTVQKIQRNQMPDYSKYRPATEDHINKVFDILKKNGARNIHKWARINVIQKVISDYMVALILMKLESDEQFCQTFVYEWLPSACRNVIPEIHPLLSLFSNFVEDACVGVVTSFKTATKKDIEEVAEKAKSYFLEKVGAKSIFSVQDASRIIRGCVNETELSKERSRELLEKVDPFIYGGTPLYESLEKATELFRVNAFKNTKHKLLFVLSDGDPSDCDIRDTLMIDRVVSKLREEDVNVVTCFITDSIDIQPKRLYDEMPADWEPGAKFLFSLSTELSTQLLPRAILVKRGWIIDVANNETKLFMQVNHPDNLREACAMARDVVYCQDSLSDLLVSVDLDIYINQSNGDFKPEKQVGKTCYAHASATVLHLAMKRIFGREGGYPDFHALKEEVVNRFGSNNANTRKVLKEICPKYRLHCRKVHLKDAMQAIVEKRPVVARFRLTRDEWKIFGNFYKNNPTGVLTESEIDVSKRSAHALTYGHAVVLTSYNSKCLTFMNSSGPEWADMGFFRVQKAKLLNLKFLDVYWTLEDLSEVEKTYYDKHGPEVARKLMATLKGLQNAEYTCPKCSVTSLVTAFTGTLLKVKCPKCWREFSTNDNAGNILALNMYLTSLSSEGITRPRTLRDDDREVLDLSRRPLLDSCRRLDDLSSMRERLTLVLVLVIHEYAYDSLRINHAGY